VNLICIPRDLILAGPACFLWWTRKESNLQPVD
jgi:hypothetical protein